MQTRKFIGPVSSCYFVSYHVQLFSPSVCVSQDLQRHTLRIAFQVAKHSDQSQCRCWLLWSVEIWYQKSCSPWASEILELYLAMKDGTHDMQQGFSVSGWQSFQTNTLFDEITPWAFSPSLVHSVEVHFTSQHTDKLCSILMISWTSQVKHTTFTKF